AAIAAFLLFRLYAVQIRDGKWLAERAYDQRVRTLDLMARRGTIYDRNGITLVRSVPSRSVYATPQDVRDKEGTARILAGLLGLAEPFVLARLRSRDSYVVIERKIPHQVADRLDRAPLDGISVVPENTGIRFVPSGRLASTLIGFTGIDENGLEGLEYAFDGILRGSPGKMSLEADQFGRALPFAPPHTVVPARAGHSVVLTLDSYLQYSVERVLREGVAKWHARSGSALVMDPWTGEILALANAPDYDLRAYDRFPPDARRDRAVTDAYEPGSTFKLITAVAALESGKVSVTRRFPARDELQIGTRVIHNAEDGFIASNPAGETLGEIIAYSHNVGAAEVGLAIGPQAMDRTLKRFGFGTPTEVELPGENPGIVPPLGTWSETTLPTISFGHGIATTPLALARAYCAIANGGLLVRPRVLSAILDESGNEIYRYGKEIERRVMSPATAATLRGYLRAVVTRGTGNPTAQIPGYTTAGKTGTAQIAENGSYVAGQYVASFVGYVPAEVPRYVILVKIERPQGGIYGSVVAAPAFAQIARLAMLHAGLVPARDRLVRAGPASKPPL
ncbi:MAG TPA: penicillin-binding protein 2, partial [Candidatus Baltobacteraceae bacterium]|nr:penicillin-binding protein 2 [Candidatus Baltobacteraceae bacterium]